MAQLGRYRTPDELQDQDKWFRFFTKPQLAVTIATLAADWNIVWLFYRLHLVVVGIVIAIFLFIVIEIATFIKMPSNKYLYGGGINLGVLGIRIIVKNLPWNKKILSREEQDIL